ncbi:unnamed protein product [Toxocara canis]|uniref:HIT-type domain-containing protein n=1 Tax=Toxocara canis TaxID=6265 RepID=A0A183U791_TOXCA|nr:unnamed protein product [Toxocara canis]
MRYIRSSSITYTSTCYLCGNTLYCCTNRSLCSLSCIQY